MSVLLPASTFTDTFFHMQAPPSTQPSRRFWMLVCARVSQYRQHIGTFISTYNSCSPLKKNFGGEASTFGVDAITWPFGIVVRSNLAKSSDDKLRLVVWIVTSNVTYTLQLITEFGIGCQRIAGLLWWKPSNKVTHFMHRCAMTVLCEKASYIFLFVRSN